MRDKKIYFFFLFAIVLLVACNSTDPETGYPIVEKDIVFIIEPHLWECSGHPGQTSCLIINGKGSYDYIRGFEHKEGVWAKILVDKFENTDATQGTLQDTNAFGFTLKKNLDEIKEEDPTPKRLCEFYDGQWTEGTEKNCRIENTDLKKKYCEHKPGEC